MIHDDSTVISGVRDDCGARVLIDGEELDAGKSLALRNHSPTGFEWGYGGSGPAQLALALLLEFTDKETALNLYQYFKWQVIAPTHPLGFEITGRQISDWVSEHRHLSQ